MDKNEFNYYIHKSPVSDYSKFFKDGLYDFDSSFRIESTIERIADEDIQNGLLQEKMKALRETDETVLLIKIPKCYFPEVVHRDGNMDVPIPFLYERRLVDELGNSDIYPVIIPNLIQGCYSKKDGFITNENYCPVFDPSGLKFSYEQLEPIKNSRYDLYQNYNKRNTLGNLESLYAFDKSSGTWDKFVEYYSHKFGVEPVLLFDEEDSKNGSHPNNGIKK